MPAPEALPGAGGPGRAARPVWGWGRAGAWRLLSLLLPRRFRVRGARGHPVRLQAPLLALPPSLGSLPYVEAPKQSEGARGATKRIGEDFPRGQVP